MVAAWSEDRRRQAVALYESGKTIVECCEALGAGSLVVQKYLRLAGVQTRPAQKRPPTQDRRQAVIDLYLAGSPVNECCKALRVTAGTVARFLREAGFELRFAPWTEAKVDKMVRAYESGLTLSETARYMCTNNGVLRKYLRRRGVRIRPHIEATPRAARHYFWKGGESAKVGKYVYLHRPNHPNATASGRVLEHRLVVEAHVGRYLTRLEVVHHKDGDRSNNHIDNLQLFASNGEHLLLEMKDYLPQWSEDGKRRVREGRKRWREEKRTPPGSKTGGPPSPASTGPTTG